MTDDCILETIERLAKNECVLAMRKKFNCGLDLSGEDIKWIFKAHCSLSPSFKNLYGWKFKFLSWLENRPYNPEEDIESPEIYQGDQKYMNILGENKLLCDMLEANIMSNDDHLIIYSIPTGRTVIQLQSRRLLKQLYENEKNELVKYQLAMRLPFWLWYADDFKLPQLPQDTIMISCYV